MYIYIYIYIYVCVYIYIHTKDLFQGTGLQDCEGWLSPLSPEFLGQVVRKGRSWAGWNPLARGLPLSLPVVHRQESPSSFSLLLTPPSPSESLSSLLKPLSPYTLDNFPSNWLRPTRDICEISSQQHLHYSIKWLNNWGLLFSLNKLTRQKTITVLYMNIILFLAIITLSPFCKWINRGLAMSSNLPKGS